VLLLGSQFIFAEAVSESDTLRMSPLFQQKLDSFWAFYNEQVESNPEMPEEEFNSRVSGFLKNCGVEGGELLIQLALAHEERDSWREKLLVRAILGQALEQLTAQAVVTQIAPYYELPMSSEIRNVLDSIFYGVLVPHGPSRPDYRPVVSYIQQSKNGRPQRLVHYMFKVNPDKALPEVQKVFGTPGAQAKALQAAANGEWWEQIYASEKMKQNPKLRDSELIGQLKQSPHAVVRETVQEIDTTQ
jgi:hypothetical protein